MASKNFTFGTSISDKVAKQIIRSVVKGIKSESATAFRRLEKNLSSNADVQAEFSKMNATLASEANAIVSSHFKGSKRPAYRGADEGNNQRHPGAMKQAIAKGYFFNASGGSLNFLDETTLAQFAPHWRRLNYGAGAAGANTPKVPIRPMRFGRGVGRKSPGFKFALKDRSPSPGFILPPGVWSSSFLPSTPASGADLRLPNGKDAFYPGKRFSASAKPKKTKGIVGQAFLDYGLDHINQEYPKRLEALAKKMVKEDIRKSGGK